MAWVTLEEPDREGAVLPDVCMKCGAAAPDRVFMDFPPVPPRWLSFFLFFLSPILLAIVARRMRMSFPVPLCETHKKSAFGRFRILRWTLFGLIVLEVLGLVVAADVSGGKWVLDPTAGPDGKEKFVYVRNGLDPGVGGLTATAAAIGLTLWAGVAIFLSQMQRLSARDITDFTITFDHVAPEFVHAYEESRIPVPVPDASVTAHWQPGGSPVPPAAPPSDNIKKES